METPKKPKEFDRDQLIPKEMALDTLLEVFGLNTRNVAVTIIKPVRNGEIYKRGRLTGFKSGIIGGGHYNYKNGFPMSFDSSRLRWIKKPKVHVTYNIFDYGGKEHSDWIDADNCTFSIIKK